MQFDLKEFRKDLEVRRIANAHYFEFCNNYHTVADKHSFHELVYVDSGKINVRAENYNGELSAGQLIVHKPDEMHELSSDSVTAPNVIIIGFECESPRLDWFAAHTVRLNIAFQRLLTEIIKECRKMFLPPYDVPRTFDMHKRANRPFGCDQMVKNLLEELLIKLIRFEEHVEQTDSARLADARMAEVCDYLRENFRQNCRIRELCRIFGTNKTTLSTAFKQQTGKTIVEYLNELKIAEAKRMMRLGDKTFTQIAEELNFSSVHYFTRLFHKLEKQSPSQYGQSIKSKLDEN